MAYTQATAADLKARFVRFAQVADATVETWLTTARRSVDDSWAEDDRAYGEMLLAAHYLTQEGLGTGTEAQLAADGLGGMKSVKSGQFSFTKSDAQANEAAGSLASTTYGQRFLELLKQNRAGSRVTASGTIPSAPLYPAPGGYFWGES